MISRLRRCPPFSDYKRRRKRICGGNSCRDCRVRDRLTPGRHADDENFQQVREHHALRTKRIFVLLQASEVSTKIDFWGITYHVARAPRAGERFLASHMEARSSSSCAYPMVQHHNDSDQYREQLLMWRLRPLEVFGNSELDTMNMFWVMYM